MTPDVGNGTIPVQPANSGTPPSAAANVNGHAVPPPGTLPPGSTDSGANPPDATNALVMIALQPDAPPSQPRTTTTSDTGHDNKRDDSGSLTDASAAVAPAANPQQPVAAVIIVNAAATVQAAAPAPADTSATPAATGELSKARVPTTLPVDPDQDGTPPRDAAGGAPGPQTPGGNNEDAAAKPASTAALVTANAADTASQPELAQGTDDAAVPGPAETNAANGTGHSNAPAAAPSTLSSSEAGTSSGQSGSGAAKVTADGLPNFGFAVATPAASSVPATIAAPASTAAVPISGLAVAIAARAQSGSNQFEIRLDPPELGRIDVHLDVDRDGQVTSHVTADRADTLALLQSQQPQLERALEQAGLKTADNGLQFTLRDQSLAGQNNNGGGGPQPQVAQLVIPDTNLAPVDATQIYTRAGLGSGLDIRV